MTKAQLEAALKAARLEVVELSIGLEGWVYTALSRYTRREIEKALAAATDVTCCGECVRPQRFWAALKEDK